MEWLIDRVVVKVGDVEIRYVITTKPENEQIRFYHLRKDYYHQAGAVFTHSPYLGQGKVLIQIVNITESWTKDSIFTHLFEYMELD